MTSIFGTFRRPKKKQSLAEGGPSDILSPSSRTSTVFSSTPNLLKIDQSRVLSPKYTAKIGQPLASQNEGMPPGWSGFEGRRRTSTMSSVGGGPDGVGMDLNKPQGSLGKKSSSMRNFLSMMNVVGTMKRSKSIRKLGWGSTLNVSSPNSKESSPAPSQLSTTSSSSVKQAKEKFTPLKSKSEEGLDDIDSQDHQSHDINLNDDLYDPKSLDRRRTKKQESTRSSSRKSKSRNNEPGVLTSSESSSSENSSLQDSSSIRASSERSEGDVCSYNSDTEEMETIKEKDPVELERKRSILQGTKKFNMDPKKGVGFLVEKGILQNTAQDVAQFLKDGYGLSKGSIGNYLGERHNFNEDVLKAFVELHNFGNLILVEALRQFLWAFRLPGESQKISRMLDAFAERYCKNNPDLGVSTDTCSVLCYSIIMLNTELHNPNVKEKVSLDQFIKRNRGIEGGELFSNQFFISLYNSILNEPFRFPEEDGNDLMLTFFNPDYEGWVYKFGGRPRSWKRLWFILSNNCLYYFKFTTDKTPLGIIPLENILVRVPPEKQGAKLHAMILYKESPDPRIIDQIKTCKTLPGGQIVPKLYSSIQLGTPERKERERWVRAINANHSMSRFYSDLTLKKAKMQLQRAAVSGSASSVRKSQISLPSSTTNLPTSSSATTLTLTTPDQEGSITFPIIPSEVLQDPRKDPNNFFISKNLSSISLHPPPLLLGEDATSELEFGVKSRSESKLYQGRKSSLEVTSSTVILTPISRARSNSNPKSPVMRRRNRHGQLQPLTSIFQNTTTTIAKPEVLVTEEKTIKTSTEITTESPEITPTITATPTPMSKSPNLPRSSIRRKPGQMVQLRTETAAAIYEKYKKLSMINELSGGSGGIPRSDGSISSSESSTEESKAVISSETLSTPIMDPCTTTTTPSRLSCSSTSSSDSSGGSEDTEFEYRALQEGGDVQSQGARLRLDSSGSHCGSSSNLLDCSSSKSAESINLLDFDKQCSIPSSESSNKGQHDFNGNLPDQIQIIDCSNPEIRTKSMLFIDDDDEQNDDELEKVETFSKDHDENFHSTDSAFCDNGNNDMRKKSADDNGNNIPTMCYESIYESNV